jgi:hypothetical protein
MEDSGQLHAHTILPLGERALSVPCVEGWMGSKASLESVENINKNSFFWHESNLDPFKKGKDYIL